MSLLLTAISILAPGAAALSAEDALARSIAYHDPQGAWSSVRLELVVDTTLTERLAQARGYANRYDRIVLDNGSGRFSYRSNNSIDLLEIEGAGDSFTAWLNGSAEIGEAERDKYGLGADRIGRWRNSFSFTYGLPMKLRDPGTRLDPEATRTEFRGREVLALRVSYDPAVGSDVWYFYLDPQTYALVGSRFFHDEAAADGEHIAYEGELAGPCGLRLPQRRLWYRNRDGEHIATEELRSAR